MGDATPAALALLGRMDEAREAWRLRPGIDRGMRHSGRFVGSEADALVQRLRLRLAGWDGRLVP